MSSTTTTTVKKSSGPITPPVAVSKTTTTTSIGGTTSKSWTKSNLGFTATPKAVLSLNNIGTATRLSSLVPAASTTIKYKRGDVSAQVALTQQSIPGYKNFKDVVAQLDYRVPSSQAVTLNSKFDLGAAKYQLGFTLDTKVDTKPVTLKAWYNNRDHLVSGEAIGTWDKNNKVNVLFNQKKATNIKYTLTNGAFTYEPQYNLNTMSALFSISKKQGAATVKATYDCRTEAAVVELSQKPFKLAISNKLGAKSRATAPSLAVSWEQEYLL